MTILSMTDEVEVLVNEQLDIFNKLLAFHVRSSEVWCAKLSYIIQKNVKKTLRYQKNFEKKHYSI